MSEENVELARQYYEAWNARDVDGARRLIHPDFEFLDPPNLPDADRYVGKDALQGRIRFFVEAGWDGQVRVPEYLDAGEEVVVIWQMRARSPHGGGLPFEETQVHVCLFKDGKLRRIRAYMSRAEALQAAGLRE
jgi:ketosteroid isomerase-like protein